ncbi:GL25338 [Drosophila persimilis]|uniref:GL25338 n=1 Tax=Drosophila persimilis TaxID=7234 RepID=B4HD87_DROPE|nr:GL25338 [Drosophila persimilis]
MSDLVGTEEFSAAQLRGWLESLNLPKVVLRGQGPPAAETCENEREDEAAADQDSTKSERKEKNEKSPQAPGHNNNHGEYRAEVEMLKLQVELLKLQSEREKEGRGENTTPAANNDAGVMLLNAAKDVLPTYHGNISGNNDDVTTWIAQFKAIAKFKIVSDICKEKEITKFVRIGIADKNDSPPYFDRFLYETEIDENADLQSTVLTVNAKDHNECE